MKMSQNELPYISPPIESNSQLQQNTEPFSTVSSITPNPSFSISNIKNLEPAVMPGVQTLIMPVKVADETMMTAQSLVKSTSRYLMSKRKYRLIRKSPIKGSPIKNISHILRKHRKTKVKRISPRKFKFILPKISKFSPRKGKQLRAIKAKALPLDQTQNNSINISTTATLRPSEHQTDSETLLQHRCHKLLDRSPSESLEEESEEQVNGNAVSSHFASNDTSLEGQEMSRPEYDAEEEEEEGDDIDQQQQNEYLAAFLKASSTIVHQKSAEKKGNTGDGEQKLSKQQRRLKDRISALSYIPDLNSHQDVLVFSYLMEVKNALSSVDTSKYEKFVDILSGLSSSSEVEDVYNRIMQVLDGFPELQEGFIMFLKPEEALQMERYPEYCMIQRMRSFVDELKHHLSRQPQNMQKVIRTLQSLLAQPNVTNEQLLTVLTPVLKLQPWLLESLSKCIPCSRPPQCDWPDDFENINLDQPPSLDGFECVSLVDDETKTTFESCSCGCHSNPAGDYLFPAQSFKSEHCLSCALRFIDGRVYLQCGKNLRLAKITYFNEGEASQPLPKAKAEGIQKKEYRQSSKLGQKVLVDPSDCEKAKKGRKSKKGS